MTKSRKPLAERIRLGLEEALEHARGRVSLNTIEHPEPPPRIDAATILAIRKKAALSQQVFGKVLSASTKTVQSWEQGKRTPSPAARRLIELLVVEPETLFRAVGLPPIRLDGFTIKKSSDGQRRIVTVRQKKKPESKLFVGRS